MQNSDDNFKLAIDNERIREAAEQGTFIFIVSLGFSIVFYIVLYDMVYQPELQTWFVVLNFINLIRWISFVKIKTHLNILNSKYISLVKFILFTGSLLSGLCWGVASLLFVDLVQPNTLLIMSLSVFFISLISILSLFSYLPAVMAFIIPAGGFLIIPLLLQENKAFIDLGLVLMATLVASIVGCIKIGRSFFSTLHLNFENLTLRQESEEKSLLLETALENIDQGISMSDEQDNLRMWNKEFTNFLGLKGKTVKSDINLDELLNSANPPLLMNKKTRSEYQLNDGRVFEVRQNEIKNGGRVLTYTDISDLIKRERALEQARETAEQVNAAKTRFLAAASHDLRQPIHALGLFFAELSEQVRSPDTEILIDQVNDSINAVNSMLNALLDISKLDAGIVKPTMDSIKLNDLFNRLKTDFTPIALESQNKLTIRDTQLVVKSDFAMLERILRNLIGNALRYTNNGRVLVAARLRGDKVLIQVIDTGIGIPDDQLDQVFIEFHQLKNPARDRRKGLGLGLAIVQRLVNLLDHTITVTSNIGSGSCFTITLAKIDTLESKLAIKEQQSHPITKSLSSRQILVLDDDKAVLQGMCGLLTRWGCQVTTAGSSIEAFKNINHQHLNLDVIIVDYRLPGTMSGIEVAEEIQKLLPEPVAVLIVTGDTGPERLREAEYSGYPLLHKPVQPAKLRSTIQYLINELDKEASQYF